MSGPSVSQHWRGYTVVSSALALPIIEEVAVKAGIGTAKPPAFEVGELESNTDDVPLVPLAQATANTIGARWVDKGTRVRIDLAKLFALRPFSIPRHTRAEIPISGQMVEGLGPCLLLHFGAATFEPIVTGKRTKTKTKTPEQPTPAAEEKS